MAPRVAWGEVAESIARDLQEGRRPRASGALRINSYEKDGVKHRTTELNVERADKSLDAKLSKNEARIVGIVREDAKARTLDSGTAMTLLSVATTTVVNGRDREDWHSITLWGKTAEAARDIKAGDTIAINGALRHRTVGDDGQERKLSAIDCRQFEVLERSERRPRTSPASGSPTAPRRPTPATSRACASAPARRASNARCNSTIGRTRAREGPRVRPTFTNMERNMNTTHFSKITLPADGTFLVSFLAIAPSGVPATLARRVSLRTPRLRTRIP